MAKRETLYAFAERETLLSAFFAERETLLSAMPERETLPAVPEQEAGDSAAEQPAGVEVSGDGDVAPGQSSLAAAARR